MPKSQLQKKEFRVQGFTPCIFSFKGLGAESQQKPRFRGFRVEGL